jgi:lysophospholipase L1-like esterase
MFSIIMGCSSEPDANLGDDFEGNVANECGDRADNDQDGLFDCDDPDCTGSPACSGKDAPTDVDIDDTDTNEGDQSTDSLYIDTEDSSHTDIDVGNGSDTGTVDDTYTGDHVDTGHIDTGTGEPVDTETEVIDPSTDTETGPPITGSSDEITPMPLISRDVPAYTSSSGGGSPNDEFYGTTWLSDGGFPIWLVYDLSDVPVEQRGWVVVHWINSDYWYSSEFEGIVPMWCPSEYTIDAHTDAGGGDPPDPSDPGWVSLVTLPSQNVFKQRQHVVNLTPGDTVYNWVRLNVTAVMGEWESIDINMDIHDAHLGVEDSWFFAGDSITAGGMSHYESGDANFSQIVNQAMPEYFPATINAGVPGFDSYEGAELLPGWLDYFPGKYVGIAFGTNDIAHHTSHDEFYANYEAMVSAVLDVGKVPVVPTIPWFREDGVELVPGLNDVIAQLKADYPEILDGPDFWAYFSENQHLISDDNLHPSDEGYNVYRRLWAEHALETIYDFQPNK